MREESFTISPAALMRLREFVARAPNPVQLACNLAGQSRIVSWGVDVGAGVYIPVKAAYFLACKYDGRVFRSTADFNTADARRALEAAGCDVRKRSPAYWESQIERGVVRVGLPAPSYTTDQHISRREFHAEYGGGRQDGIIVPADVAVILAITGSQGQKHGYHDRWNSDGSLDYYGAGQTGSMKFARGNKAIRDHVLNGRTLYVFEGIGSGRLKCLGQFVCTGHVQRIETNGDGVERNVIVFHLVPVEQVEASARSYFAGEDIDDEGGQETLAELREKAQSKSKPGQKKSARQSARTSVYERDRQIVKYVLARANGVCECCQKSAPFKKANGKPYLEAHHIISLSDGGFDDIEHVAAICPNCHRAAHYSHSKESIREQMLRAIDKKERLMFRE